MREDIRQKAKHYIRSEFIGHGLSDEEIEKVMSFGHFTKAAEDKIIFDKGDPGDGFMILLQGVIVIRSFSVEGKEAILNIITPGEVFGEMTLPDGAPRSAEALTELDPSDFAWLTPMGRASARTSPITAAGRDQSAAAGSRMAVEAVALRAP